MFLLLVVAVVSGDFLLECGGTIEGAAVVVVVTSAVVVAVSHGCVVSPAAAGMEEGLSSCLEPSGVIPDKEGGCEAMVVCDETGKELE